MHKKVSVIVNCHNGEKYLKKCISSILNQKYRNLELIFFDNFSSDNSKKIIINIKDDRIKYFFSNKKLSLYAARNEAVEVSLGEIIAFLDVDDWWDENYLSSRALPFNDDNQDFFYCNRYTFYEKNKKLEIFRKLDLPNGKIYNYLAKDYFITISGLIIKKEIFDKVGLFNKDFNIIGDFDLVMRMSRKFNGHATNEPLLFYRYHKNNFSKINIEMFFKELNKWFNDQVKLEDKDFLNNIKYFEKKLLTCEIKNLLFNSGKNFYLLHKIVNHPDLFEKLKFLIVFLMPKKVVNYFKK
jgi:glycosyltransferase involved in cell wall biosynthesis